MDSNEYEIRLNNLSKFAKNIGLQYVYLMTKKKIKYIL